MKNQAQRNQTEQAIDFMKEQLDRWQMIKERFVATQGIIIKSSDYAADDGEPGKAIIYRFTTAKNEIVEAEYQSTLHWPSKEQWARYVEEHRVGAQVSLLYDPDNPEDNVGFFTMRGVEGSMENDRQVLQRLEMSLAPK